LLVGAADAAVPVVGGDRGEVAVAEPDAGVAFPLGLEPVDLVQPGGGDRSTWPVSERAIPSLTWSR
jgi:hypothetical protein